MKPFFNKILLFQIIIFVLLSFTLSHAQLEKVAGGFEFVEGPVWKNGELLFSDIPANTVYRWTEDSGISVYLQPSGKSNGLALDLDGNLLLAQHGKRRVAKLDSEGTETAVATHYDGKQFNSPNDMAVRSDGSIFFTDPPYGLEGRPSYLGFNGIFRISPDGQVHLLDNSLQRPNGIIFSPDESKLYVADAEARNIYLWDVDGDIIINKRVFAYMNASGYADGMAMAHDGILFATGPNGIWIYDSTGTLLDNINIPEQTANCNWGNADGRMLYITADSVVYRIPNTYSDFTDLPDQKQGNRFPESSKLFNNYPNPFNASTRIPFYMAKAGIVTISILNTLGENVAILVNRTYGAGHHVINWSADNYSSGLYYIRLATANGIILKKCLLIK